MTQITGPDVAQVAYKPVVDLSDSKKNADAVVMKIAGSYGSSEFTPDELVMIYQYLGEFLTAKGLSTSDLKRADAGFYNN